MGKEESRWPFFPFKGTGHGLPRQGSGFVERYFLSRPRGKPSCFLLIPGISPFGSEWWSSPPPSAVLGDLLGTRKIPSSILSQCWVFSPLLWSARRNSQCQLLSIRACIYCKGSPTWGQNGAFGNLATAKTCPYASAVLCRRSPDTLHLHEIRATAGRSRPLHIMALELLDQPSWLNSPLYRTSGSWRSF